MSDDYKNSISYKEYWDEVRDIAKEIVRETKDQKEDRGWAFDRLFEYIDGHEWVIYTWANPYVLIHCSNEDALFDVESTVETSSYADIMMKMAFYALHEDASVELEEQLGKARIR
jgi:hypothetical protein